MIVNFLIDMLMGLIDFLTSGLNIPALPPEVMEIAASVTQYIVMGLQFIANYTHLDYLLTLFGIVAAIDGSLLVYKFIMWVLRKIPMLGIE